MAIAISTDIYLDANATTRVLPAAADEAKAAMEELFGNPSSSHVTGIRARHILEQTRGLVRSLLGAEDGQIIFTSGATEAIQMAIFSALVNLNKDSDSQDALGRFLLYGATEHKAVPQALGHWKRVLGLRSELLAIPVDSTGKLDLEFLENHADRADIVCTMAVNNETGVIHDLDAIETTLRRCNESVPWLVDCVQALGKLPLNLSSTTVDFASISGHKLHAPKGIGVLYVRDQTPLTPLFAGGGQENGARSGTENLPGVAALSEVLRHLSDEHDSTFKDLETLDGYRERLVQSLKTALPTIVFNTDFQNAVPTTINFSVEGFSSKEIMDLFDAAGIRVSSGSACGSSLRGSYVLDAMGLPKWRSEGAIRISFGLTSQEVEIESACKQIEAAGRALRESCVLHAGKSVANPLSTDERLIQLKSGSMCTWILIDSNVRRCVIIDPVDELSGRIENYVRCQGLQVFAILDTHLHVDHQSNREALLHLLKDRLVFPDQSTDPMGWPENADGVAILGDGSEAEYLNFSEEQMLVRTGLAGHTIDSHALLFGCLSSGGKLAPSDIDFAFTGDTVQIGGIGRTDFSSSSIDAMYGSLRRLPHILSHNTPICPTHDYRNGFATTLETELRDNDFLAHTVDPLAPISLEQFKATKQTLDAKIDDESNEELVCGLILSDKGRQTSIDIAPAEREHFFAKHKQSRIIDVRERQEFQFSQDWSSVGLAEPPENVPLTRLTGLLQELLVEPRQPTSGDLIFVCRSGNRSGIAADMFRRMGFKNAYHIAGGLALGIRPNGISADSVDHDFMI